MTHNPQLLRDDAPILALLSLRENPLLATASQEELLAVVKKARERVEKPIRVKILPSGPAVKKPKTTKPPSQATINLALQD